MRASSGVSRFLSAILFLVSVQAAARVQPPPGQEQLAEALGARKRVHYIEALDLVVAKILPDDSKGREHQKWIMKLADGHEVTAVYNIDTGDRIPIRLGDVVSVGGEFIWTKNGGLLHWLHADPTERRPDGYVLHRGQKYGELDEFKDLPRRQREAAVRRKLERERRLRDPRYSRYLERIGFGPGAAEGALKRGR